MHHRTIPLPSSALALLLTLGGGLAAAAETPPVLYGFDAAGTVAQRALEQRFDAAIKPEDQREWLRQMSAEPNQVGSAHDEANARFMLE